MTTNPTGILDALNDVAEFHRTFGHPILDRPTIPPPDRQVLRSALLRDEYLREFDPAWAKCAKLSAWSSYIDGSPPTEEQVHEALSDMADVICDLIYYLLGTALEYGLPLEEVWQEVQRSNMAKLWTEEEYKYTDRFADRGGVGIPPDWTVMIVKHVAATGSSRCWAVRSQGGKVEKPPSWKEPDVKGIIRRAMAKQLTNKELAS